MATNCCFEGNQWSSANAYRWVINGTPDESPHVMVTNSKNNVLYVKIEAVAKVERDLSAEFVDLMQLC